MFDQQLEPITPWNLGVSLSTSRSLSSTVDLREIENAALGKIVTQAIGKEKNMRNVLTKQHNSSRSQGSTMQSCKEVARRDRDGKRQRTAALQDSLSSSKQGKLLDLLMTLLSLAS